MLHITIAHVLHTCIQMRATSCACMWHACGAEPIFVYAAHAIWCSTCAAYMHSMCSKEADICAAHKQHFCKGSTVRISGVSTCRVPLLLSFYLPAIRNKSYVKMPASPDVNLCIFLIWDK